MAAVISGKLLNRKPSHLLPPFSNRSDHRREQEYHHNNNDDFRNADPEHVRFPLCAIARVFSAVAASRRLSAVRVSYMEWGSQSRVQPIMRRKSLLIAVVFSLPALALVLRPDRAVGQNESAKDDAAALSPPVEGKPPETPKLPEPKGAKRLSEKYDVWLDPKQKAVIVDGQVSLREGMLEMFACTRNSKEHESIVSANTKAFVVHTALLYLGAEPGHPVQFVPKYRPPTGTEIEVTVMWHDERGKEKTARAQDWIRDIRTNKAMTHPFVFAGSFFRVDEETGKRYYQAEGGDFICVSNFSTAMLDIPVESSKSEAELEFEAFTERIPPLGAPVRLIFKPKLKKQGARGREQGSQEPAKESSSGARSSSGPANDAAERN
jgi:hypothetical protein